MRNNNRSLKVRTEKLWFVPPDWQDRIIKAKRKKSQDKKRLIHEINQL